MDETGCKTLLCFDMSTSSGFHAQLTGILAGLAFASIVLILQSTTLSGRGAEVGLLSFFSALITLIMASFLYGTAAGEELIAGRTAIMIFLAGITSAVAVLELFDGLTWLVRAGGFPNATEMTARITTLVAPLITFAYLAITALNEVSVTTGREMVGSPVFVFLLLLSLLLVLVLLLVQIAWGSPEVRRLGHVVSVQAGSRAVAVADLGRRRSGGRDLRWHHPAARAEHRRSPLADLCPDDTVVRLRVLDRLARTGHRHGGHEQAHPGRTSAK
jgi:hypothetical protein